jgi:methionyl-tRNA formyltransferase
MRFAFAGIDMLGAAFETLLAAGWRPLHLFTRPCDGVLDFNDRVVQLARQHRIPIQISRITRDDIRSLADRGCECLVVAGYPWLVTGWEGLIPYAFNIHPAPLPEARGPYPLMRAILEGRKNWGVTAHELAPAFDTGAVLLQELFPISESETHDSLLARCQFGAGRLAGQLSRDLPALWEQAAPQGPGSYWNRTTDVERRLDWRAGVAHVLRQVRAFGSIETIANVGGSEIYVSAATGWEELHPLPVGAIAHRYQRHLTVAASDGFVILTRWSPIPLGSVRDIGR